MDLGRVTRPWVEYRVEYHVEYWIFGKFLGIKVKFLLDSGNNSFYKRGLLMVDVDAIALFSVNVDQTELF